MNDIIFVKSILGFSANAEQCLSAVPAVLEEEPNDSCDEGAEQEEQEKQEARKGKLIMEVKQDVLGRLSESGRGITVEGIPREVEPEGEPKWEGKQSEPGGEMKWKRRQAEPEEEVIEEGESAEFQGEATNAGSPAEPEREHTNDCITVLPMYDTLRCVSWEQLKNQGTVKFGEVLCESQLPLCFEVLIPDETCPR